MKGNILRNVLLISFLTLFLIGCAPKAPVNNYIDTPPSTIDTAETPATPTAAEGQAKSGYSGAVLAGDKTPYLDFTRADYDKAVSDGKIILLYFYDADNCPLCLTERKGLYEAFNEMSNSNLIGFRVNFEDSNTDASEEALAVNLGVEGAHTKVILKDGKKLQIVSSTWSKSDFINQMTRYLE